MVTKEAKRRGWTEAHVKKEWVGLTDEEIVEVLFELKTETMGVIRTERLARAIEAKLKEKNNG